MEFTAGENDAGRRLDRVVRRLWHEAPLSHIHRELRLGRVRVNGRARKGAYRVESGDRIALPIANRDHNIAEAATEGPGRPGLGSSLAAVWDNEHLAAFSKPAGTPTIGEGSLAEAVTPGLAAAAQDSLSFRPGPLHRLDRNTSGLVLFSKSLRGARRFGEAQDGGELSKFYLGIVGGEIETPGRWNAPLTRDRTRRLTLVAPDGRAAETDYRPLAVGAGPDTLTLCLFVIRSGFTHQIRAHAAAGGAPLAGDRKYGGAPFPGPSGYYLHAVAIVPKDPDDVFRFEVLWAPPPARFLRTVEGRFGAETAESLADFRRFEGTIRTTLER